MKTQEALYKAVQHTLNKTTFKATIDNERLFYKLARENGLSGMLFSALDQSSLSQEVVLAFQKDFYLYNAQHEKQMLVYEDLTKLFNEAKIKHIFLKGIPLKNIYPEAYMRSMGDIDILIEAKDLKKVHTLLKQNHYKNLFNSDQHDNFEHQNGMMIEVHPKLYKAFNDKYAPLFKDVWQETIQIEHYQYGFKPIFEVSYLLYHMVKHFYGTGVGLRTVLDIGIYLNHHKNAIQLDTLIKTLEEASLLTFFKNILYLNKQYFNINPYPSVLKDYTMEENLYNELTKYILQSGVHGTGTNFNAFVGRLGTSQLQNKGRIRFMLSILFPSYQQMKGSYRWLKYLPFLLPLTWLLRIIKLSLLKTRRSFRKFKQLFVKKENIDKTKAIFEKLGL